MSKAAGMKQVLAIMSSKGSPLIYTAAKKICDAAGSDVGYSGDCPALELEGVRELLQALHKEFGKSAVGSAPSVTDAIQKRIDESGKGCDNKSNPTTKLQSNGSRRSSEVGERTGSQSDKKMGS